MSRIVPVTGGSLSVDVQGTGKPIVLVHGFPLDRRMWREQIGPLSATHQVINPDLRGFGQSVVTPGETTMVQMADDLAAMLDGLAVREPVVLCGLSMGGYIAWQFFLRHRDRLAGLILCDTRAVADSPDSAALRHKAAAQVLADGPEALAEAMHHRMFSRSTKEHRTQITTFIREMMLGQSREGIAAAARGLAARIDATPVLAQIDVPALLVVGNEDKISPADEMRDMARQIRGAEFAEIPDVGHMAPLEAPGPVNAAMLAFLDRNGL